MALGNLPVPGRPTIWMIVGQGPTALAVGAGGGCLDIFTLIYPFSPLSPSLWETARYRLKYCLKGPLNPRQPTNQSCNMSCVIPWSCDATRLCCVLANLIITCRFTINLLLCDITKSICVISQNQCRDITK